MDEWNELDEYLSSMEDVDTTEEPPPIGNEAEADRDLRRLASLSRREARVKDAVSYERDRLQTYLQRQQEIVENARRWLTLRLEGYALANYERSGTKTVSMPWGTLRLARRTRVMTTDDTPPVNAPPALVRVTRSWDRRALAGLELGPVAEDVPTEPGWCTHEALLPDGTPCPGVYLSVNEAAFSASPNVESPE